MFTESNLYKKLGINKYSKTFVVMMLTVGLFAIYGCEKDGDPSHITYGDVSDTWTLANSPYYIEGDITIPVGATLTIEPGVKVEFQGHYIFFVKGRLLAIGTKTNQIAFTINDKTGFDDPFKPEGGWHSLRFFNTNYNGQDSSKVVYCTLEYSKATIDKPGSRGGAIYCYNSSDILIKNCLITNNIAFDGGGITCQNNSNPIISNCTLINNYAYNQGGAIYFELSSPTIRWNNILNNTAGTNNGGQGGGISGNYESSAIIERNLIQGNSAVVYVLDEYQGDVERVGGGGMVFDDNCNPWVINNTLDNNYTVYGNGGGILVGQNAYPIIRNNIISNCPDGEGIYVSSIGDKREIFYNDVWNNADGNFAGNTFPHISNISLDPLFLDPTNGNFHLSENSPCIDAGDPTYPLDPDGTITDIGKFYYSKKQ